VKPFLVAVPNRGKFHREGTVLTGGGVSKRNIEKTTLSRTEVSGSPSRLLGVESSPARTCKQYGCHRMNAAELDNVVAIRF